MMLRLQRLSDGWGFETKVLGAVQKHRSNVLSSVFGVGTLVQSESDSGLDSILSIHNNAKPAPTDFCIITASLSKFYLCVIEMLH